MKIKVKDILGEEITNILFQSSNQIGKGIVDNLRSGLINVQESSQINKELFEKGREKMNPYFGAFFAYAISDYIKDKNLSYYEKISSEIKKYKGEAEIDLDEFTNKFLFKELFKVDKEERHIIKTFYESSKNIM